MRELLPIIIGHRYRTGLLCIRNMSMGGNDLYVVTIKKEYQTGAQYDIADIEHIHAILHFCDKSSVEETIKCLQWILKRGVNEE